MLELPHLLTLLDPPGVTTHREPSPAEELLLLTSDGSRHVGARCGHAAHAQTQLLYSYLEKM
jgi:hypothetical protein